MQPCLLIQERFGEQGRAEGGGGLGAGEEGEKEIWSSAMENAPVSKILGPPLLCYTLLTCEAQAFCDMLGSSALLLGQSLLRDRVSLCAQLGEKVKGWEDRSFDLNYNMGFEEINAILTVCSQSLSCVLVHHVKFIVVKLLVKQSALHIKRYYS